MLEPPSLDDWPKLTYDPRRPARRSRRVTKRGRAGLEARRGAAAQRQVADRPRRRAQAHGRDAQRGRVNCRSTSRGRFIYYVGPVDPVRDEVVGPAGPTTATRMDKFTEQVLAQTGLLGMVGKAERGPAAIEAIRKHQSVYLMAVGGAAYLVSKAIKAAKVLALPISAWRRSTNSRCKDMPVTVAVDSKGTSCIRRARKNGRRGSARFRWWKPLEPLEGGVA
jgi:fumarate hydratase class I